MATFRLPPAIKSLGHGMYVGLSNVGTQLSMLSMGIVPTSGAASTITQNPTSTQALQTVVDGGAHVVAQAAPVQQASMGVSDFMFPAAVGAVILYYREANDGRELIETSSISTIAFLAAAKGAELLISGHPQYAKMALGMALATFGLGVARYLTVDLQNSRFKGLREMHDTATSVSLGAEMNTSGVPKLNERLEAEDKGGILAGAITETERIVREDRELLDRLGLDADDFQLTDVLKGVRVIENCTRSHMRERCQYDHASGIMLVSSNATQLDICRALVSALICKSLEARIDTPEMIWIRKGMEALPTESTSLQMRQIVKHATEIADELRDRRGGDRLGRLDSSWKHNGAAMVYEYLLRRHPERVEALISRVVKNIGTERQRGVRRAFNRIILPFFNVVSWPMTRLAGFVLEHILPSPTNRLHPRQRNLLTSGARGRRSRRLQDEVVQRDILTFVRNSMGVGEA